jgi:uncharacterized membrane-anchored protein
MRRYCFVALLLATLGTSSMSAQDSMPEGWATGPTVGKLGALASVSVPDGYLYLDAKATKTFLEEGQNIPNGDELGGIFRPLGEKDYWFAIFTYDDTGHVDDSERDSIDADALMKTLKDGNRRGNEERKRRGWEAVLLEGWYQRPFYDQATNNLTWATEVSSEGAKSINHSVRLLGRTGTMRVQLVADSASIETATSEFNTLLKGYTYNPGRRYAEFRQGDKLAGYGLTALIAGGVGAAAVKTGILQKLGKLIIVLIVGAAAALKKFFSALFGKKDKTITEQYMPGTQQS